MLELQMHEAHLLRRQKMTVSQIADELGCSERTVYYYLSETPRVRKKRVYIYGLSPGTKKGVLKVPGFKLPTTGRF